jgi:two-component system NtrC family sensor kinase
MYGNGFLVRLVKKDPFPGMAMVRFFLLGLLLLVLVSGSKAQVIRITDRQNASFISASLEQLVDTTNQLTAEQVNQSTGFVQLKGSIPVFSGAVKNVWFRFGVQNGSVSPTLLLNIAYPNLSQVSLYALDNNQAKMLGRQGTEIPSAAVIAGSPNLVYDLQLAPGTTRRYLLHVYSEHPIIVPAEVHTYDALHNSINIQTIVTGLYLGVLAVMFLYNLFLFYGTRDNSYLYYIIYIFCLALAQVTVAGYGYRYLWPEQAWLNRYAVVVTSTFSALSGLLFSIHFLRTKFYTPKLHRWLLLLASVYVAGLLCSLLSLPGISYAILNYNGLVSVVSVLATSVIIARKGFKAAYFYLFAWLLLLVSFSILIFRNLSLLPYNNFTTYTIYLGSALEVALLSIALADKINALRKEKEQSQAEALKASLENEKLVRDQNIVLERKVAERTEELQATNENLSDTLQNLKETQSQLVEAEKMASLGQLTAGIAHEINNPINFVKSNIKPLQLDINDLVEVIDAYEQLHTTSAAEIPAKLTEIDKLKKQIDIDYVRTEIDSLVKGIQEGAERTAEIVLGLRTFSRLDESEVKTVNVHEGIESTIVLLKNALPPNISIKKDFQSQGEIECFPGKLNQVFMNILSNGIQAIKEKEEQQEEESITISTRDIEDRMEISIRDTGMGMTEEVKQKIFDPFFTTKDVGEGTGLGLSIVYKIIQKHGGKIEVHSTRGKGAEFVISLFRVLPETALT